MSMCITASRMMTAREVSEHCRKMMESEALMLVLELAIKKKYLEAKQERKALTA